MENRDKAISLFKYIMQLYAQRYQVVTEIKNQEWLRFFSDIPNDDKNIKINYMDRTTSENENSIDNSFLLEVRKPEFDLVPELPKVLEEWLEESWDDFNEDLKIIEQKVIKKEDGEQIETFNDKKARQDALKKFEIERNVWAGKQKIIEATRKLFNELYAKYIDLSKDSETYELMVGQGLLKSEMLNNKKALHPILLKRVAIEFDALNNIIRIVDTDSETELYTMLLQGIDFINHSVIKNLKEELEENFYHPLDRIETVNFLKSLVHSLHSESKYIESQNENRSDEKLVIYDKPVFFVRKKTSGVVKSIEEIIKQLEEGGEVSGPLLNLIGENIAQYDVTKKEESINETLSAISGEDRKILLSKEANREQLEIAKRIEDYNAVLVQGPPGTGKTHTIANLMGHFLAQGKNILVTSHTKKALTVVKEKLSPELQNLCVSVLDDNSKDMEKSIDGITEYISSHSALELEKNIVELTDSRDKILDDLDSVRKEIFDVKSKEFENIKYGDESYNIAEAAKFVYENREQLSYIPGKINFNKEFPLSEEDIELVYKTNEFITLDEEKELGTYLPNPALFISPEELKNSMGEEDTKLIENSKIIALINRKDLIIDHKIGSLKIAGKNLITDYNEKALRNLKQYLLETDFNNSKIEEWCSYAVFDGQKGGGFKAIWEKFAQRIEEAYNYAGNNVENLLGKSIEGDFIKSNQTLISLREMREHIAKGKKINSFSFFKPKEWMEIYDKVKINGNTIETVEECDTLIANCELTLKREEVSRMWYELIEKRGGENFKSFGEEPEQGAIKYVNKIRTCVNWYDSIYLKIKTLIDEANINFDLIVDKKEFMSSLDEVDEILKTIYFYLPKYIELLININSNLSPITIKYEQTKEILSKEEARNSKILLRLSTALENRNIEDYIEALKILSGLYEKNNYIVERQRILNAMKDFAPEWMAAIKNRTGIHGQGKAPENIKDALKWKKFTSYIESITKLPFEELQYKSVTLSKDLRKITTKLVEAKAWYQLLIRIEKDISQKQALQGWKLTVKKIGKGTGKTAPALKREAKKLMAKCQMAVPAWVMPINKALESLDPKTNKFDIVIIDEASQSDISALAILYLAKKIIIVGDDEQVSPSAVGSDVERMNNLSNMYIKDIIPNSHLYDMKSSLYDIAKTTFPTLMLREHFRCVPNIIGYSNRLAYDYKIKALRDDSSVPVKPATISYHIENGVRDNKRKVNEEEAKNIIALIKACMEFDEYKNMSFGVISLLGDEQAEKINSLAMEKIKPIDFEERKILCGNASQFQGDERDVIFISLVDNNEGEAPLRMTGEGTGKATKQRYNVAVSRAKNQLWIVHSLDVGNDLKSGDMRRELIEYAINPENFKEQKLSKAKVETNLELTVANELKVKGYNIVPDWKVGSYRIDMVAVYRDKKIAIECDGDLSNTVSNTIKDDMEKQTVLERLGWRFIRVRASEYYSNPIETMYRIEKELAEFGIQKEDFVNNFNANELKEKVIRRAKEILADF